MSVARKHEAVDEHLATNLRVLRDRKNMSQAELAGEMAEKGIPWHQSTVARVESGRQAVRFAEAAALAEIFGVPLQRFTWAPADARAADWLDMAANRLRGAYEDTVRAVVVQQSAEELAKRAIEDTARHQEPLVAEAREIVRRAITDYGPLEAAFDEGVRAYRERHGSDEERGGDGGHAEGEPRMDGQRTAS